MPLPTSLLALSLTFPLLGASSLGSSSPPTQATAKPTATCSSSTTRPESFGAKGDGKTDDSRALTTAFSKVPAGGTLCFTAGRTYNHSTVLTLTQAGVTLTGGGTLASTNPVASAIILRGSKPTVNNLTLTSQATTRYTAREQMKLAISGVDGATLNQVHIKGSAAAGVFLEGATHFKASSVTVANTMADGFTMTGGSAHGVVTGVSTTNTGDDGISIVSYHDEVPVTDVTVSQSSVTGQTWGRGMSVVGGRNITYKNNRVTNSAGAALYLASEAPPNNTLGDQEVTVDGLDIYHANQNSSIAQGAVLLYGGNPQGPLQDIHLRGVRVHSQSAYAGRAFGMACEPAPITGVTYKDLTVSDAPVTPFWTDCSEQPTPET